MNAWCIDEKTNSNKLKSDAGDYLAACYILRIDLSDRKLLEEITDFKQEIEANMHIRESISVEERQETSWVTSRRDH